MGDPNRKIRWGVLGWARIAREGVIPALLRSSNSEFQVLGSRDPGKRAECRAKFPGARVLPGYQEVLDDPEVDAVYIPLPNSMHREWTLKAAARGKHVLCEKPLALDAAEGREMACACADAGVLLMEAFMYRYTDRTRRVLEVLRAGRLGQVRFVDAGFRFSLANPASIKLKPELGGGSLYDVGCYPVNFAGLVADFLAGGVATARPASVAAEFVRTETGVDALFSGILRYPSGLVAALHSGFNAHPRTFAEIVGTEGVLHVPEPFFGHPGSLLLTRGEERAEIPVAETDRYRAEVEDFADAILGRRAPLLGLPETVRNLEVMDGLHAAGRSAS